MRVLGHFDAWRLDIVFAIWLLKHFVPKHILKQYLKQFSTQKLVIVQNILIPSSPKNIPEEKCGNTLISKNIPGGKMC